MQNNIDNLRKKTLDSFKIDKDKIIFNLNKSQCAQCQNLTLLNKNYELCPIISEKILEIMFNEKFR